VFIEEGTRPVRFESLDGFSDEERSGRGEVVLATTDAGRAPGEVRDAYVTRHPVPCSEVCKPDGSLTCQSIVID
jgi:hypothetical protein